METVSCSTAPSTPREADAVQANSVPVTACQAASRWCAGPCPELGALRGHEAAKGKHAAPWWRLVWCHERCHKQECEPRRKVIAEQAKDAGADLVCLKKASKFAMWLAQAQRPPFALLTDWREVKPCLQTAATHRPQNRPAFTIILAELPRHHERASAWAQGLSPRADPVHICQDISQLNMFFADLVGRLVSSAALRTQVQPLPQQLGHQPVCAAYYGLTCAGERAVPGAARWCDDVRARQTAVAMLPPGAFQTAHAAPKVREAWGGQKLVSWPVAQVLSPVCGSQSPVQLEQLLKEAMPDHYDD